MQPALPLAFVATLAWAAAGPMSCSGEHDDLGVTDASSSGSAGPGSGGEGLFPEASSSSAGGGGGRGPVGPTRLTVVNGVVDYDEVLFCALGHPDGENAARGPWPAEPLPFAGSGVVDPVAELVPEGVDVRLHVLAGDLSAAQGKSCGELVGIVGGGGAGGAGGSGPSPPPGLLVSALPVLPAQVFSSGKSVLLVPAGCMGGRDHTAAGQELACGRGYSPSAPTIGLFALGMDGGATQGKVALQAVHASMAMDTVDVRIDPGDDSGTTFLLAPLLGLGAVGPKPPYTDLSDETLGSLSEAAIEMYSPGFDEVPLARIDLDEALDHGGLTHRDVTNSEAFTLVAVGAAPGVDAGSWWHALTLTAVRAMP